MSEEIRGSTIGMRSDGTPEGGVRAGRRAGGNNKEETGASFLMHNSGRSALFFAICFSPTTTGK
ncbi:MAG: hypothetical protein ACPL4I_07890 [Bacteroidota bacterium]